MTMKYLDEQMEYRVYGVDGINERFDSNGECVESWFRSTHRSNACGYCGRLHPTDRMGWRNDRGEKVPCENCRERR